VENREAFSTAANGGVALLNLHSSTHPKNQDMPPALAL
jgi:hypothetical protein